MAENFADILSSSDRGVRLRVKAKPGVRSGKSGERPVRIVQVAPAGLALEIAVAAPAREGRANEAILALLSEELRVRKADLSITSGATGRLKLIEVSGNPQALYAKVTGWLKAHGLDLSGFDIKRGG